MPLVCAVPLRGCGFEIRSADLTIAERLRMEFPSPCGDVVLKYDRIKFIKVYFDGFRPLAGMWF